MPLDDPLDYFFEISLDMLCLANLEGYFLRVNPAFTRTLGYSEEELLAVSFLELVHPDDQAATLAELEKLARGENTLYFENRYRCADGSWKWLSWTCPGAPAGAEVVYAVARDITRQKREAEAREKLILDLTLALERIESLEGLIPICSCCKKVRDDHGYWERVESYISNRTRALFSHGLCPDCIGEFQLDRPGAAEGASPPRVDGGR